MYEEMIEFFNKHATEWDSYQREIDFVRIEEIIKRGGFEKNDIVLDVGCGTGVLIPFLKTIGINNIQAIDISPEMAEVFSEKFSDIKILTGNYEDNSLFEKEYFSKIIIFNAFPHFINPGIVIKNSFNYLRNNGSLIIAHSLSRKDLNNLHKDAGKEVADDVLISNTSLNDYYLSNGFVDIVIDDGDYFFSMARKNNVLIKFTGKNKKISPANCSIKKKL